MQGKALGVGSGAKEGDRQGVTLGETLSSMMPNKDDSCKEKETVRLNKTTPVAPKLPTPTTRR